jgi:spoIIIJ-associated protein
VEIVEAKKAAFLFGGGKVRIRVHLDEERQGGGSWSADAHPEVQLRQPLPHEEDGDRQPEDYRHPDDWQQPRSRGPRRQGGRSNEQRSRRGGSKSGVRRGPGDRHGYGRTAHDRNGYRRDGYDRDAAPSPPREALEPANDFERQILEFLRGLFEHVGIEAAVRIVFREDRKIGLDVDSPDSGILIGKRGQTLEAIQTVTNVVAGRLKNSNLRVIVDSQNYRLRREKSLIRMAQQTAEEVRRSGKSRLLDAMNPFERRLIHTTLSEEVDIETASEGEGLYKRVRILYKGPQSS